VVRQVFNIQESSFMEILRRQIESLKPWFHNLHLPDGSQTSPDHPLGDFPYFKWSAINSHIPLDLSGWSVLDIGCNAGFYSFELAKRGATVTAIDIDDHYLDQARWAASIFELSEKITFEKRQVYSFAKSSIRYDLVWFMGVLYHLRYPLLSLDIIYRITKKMMVFQTMTMPGNEDGIIPENINLEERTLLNNPWWPKMAFVENKIDEDPTNWWVPGHSCVHALLRASGFKVIAEPAHEICICEVEDDNVDNDDLRKQEYRAAVGWDV
jgi:tRNA (mo5U34)-methyltransferase